MRRGISRAVALWAVALWLTLGTLGLAGAGWPVSGANVAAAQDLPDLPEIGDQLLADPLSSGTIFPGGACPTGRSAGGYIDEGFRLSVTGACRPGSDTADVAVLGRGVSVPDGDVSVAFKVVAGGARAGLSLYTRVRERNSVGAYVNPGSGEVTLFKIVDGSWTALASRLDGQSLLTPDDWNRLSVRLSDTEVWLLLNGVPVLYAPDVAATPGGIGLRLIREGRVDDDEEATVVFADLVVSGLADGTADRAPTRQ